MKPSNKKKICILFYYSGVEKAFLVMIPNPEALKEKPDKFKYIRNCVAKKPQRPS